MRTVPLFTYLLFPVLVGFSVGFSTPPSFAEDLSHGPHAGAVSGRGDVLAEALQRGNALHVHFIDQKYTDLPLENTKVTASFVIGKTNKPEKITCSLNPQFGFFECALPKGKTPAQGDKVTISREAKNSKSLSFEYSFPLKQAVPING